MNERDKLFRVIRKLLIASAIGIVLLIVLMILTTILGANKFPITP